MALKQTPSQTVGPYFAFGLTPEQYGYPLDDVAGAVMCGRDIDGERIRIEGRVLDGEGAVISDAMIELWQADAQGRYAHPRDPRGSNAGFAGFGRCGTGTDPDKRFVFDTIKPGSIGDGHAPHINVTVFMRGLLVHGFTRIYFADEEQANAADPVLTEVPEARRATLTAARGETPSGTIYRFDIHMQGAQETVFFDV